MSNTASNYDVKKLLVGTTIIAVAILVVSLLLWPFPEKMKLYRPLSCLTMIAFLIYGMMMFASSYVEEEHHFWYWTSSGWLALLLLKA